MMRQTKMAPRAPILNLSLCPSCTSSQFSPQYPSGQMQRYRRRGSRFIHVPPFIHGKSRHSFRSTQPLVSVAMMRPSLQLQQQQQARIQVNWKQCRGDDCTLSSFQRIPMCNCDKKESKANFHLYFILSLLRMIFFSSFFFFFFGFLTLKLWKLQLPTSCYSRVEFLTPHFDVTKQNNV